MFIISCFLVLIITIRIYSVAYINRRTHSREWYVRFVQKRTFEVPRQQDSIRLRLVVVVVVLSTCTVVVLWLLIYACS